MKNFKKFKLLLIGLISSIGIMAQQAPTNNNPSGNASGTNDKKFWSRAGNTMTQGTNNIFGTMWNSPIYTYSAGLFRTILNGDRTVPNPRTVGLPINTDGFMGLNTLSPYARLHISAPGSFGVFGGYRDWMREGLLLQKESDHLWLGIRSVTPLQNDAILNWGDDPSSIGAGPDNMLFVYTEFGTAATGAKSDNGLEIMRLTPEGDVGIGPVFSNTTQPTSLLHLNRELTQQTWLQVTNQTGTGQTANDGLRMGITGTGTAHIRQQENLPLIFYTNSTENVRIEPAAATTMGANVGMLGLGNWTTAANILNPINAKLDIDGDVRIRTVTEDSNLVQVLVIDSSDLNRVHWRNINLNNTTANNGVSVNALNQIQLGVPCNIGGNPNTIGVNANSFTESRVVPNRNFDLWFASGNNETGGVGFGGQFIPIPFCGTGNTVEISANMKNPQYGNTDASGLRFTKLLSTSPTIANGTNGVDNTKVLTVDADGDVVLTDAASGLGNYCGTTPINPLASNYEIDMNHNNMYFTNNGQVYMGDVACGVNNLARLFVRNTFPSTTTSTGFWSEAGGLPNQTAGFFNGSRYGVHANTGAGGFTGMSAAVYAVGATPGSGNSINSWAGYFNGDVFTTASQYFASDNILKENISPINNALDKLRLIDAVTFNFKNSNFPSMNLPQGLEYGVIAQNVATVLPDLVKNITHPEELDSLGNVIHQSFQFEGVNYTELIPVLIAGVKELDSLNLYKDDVIKALDNRLTNLEECLNKSGICLTTNQKNEDKGNEGVTIELSNLNAIVLDQNSPNPFAEKTTIKYLIPEDVMNAQLLFYDMNGRIINTVEINERGNGKLTVYGENLQKGIYTYSLIADGKLISTKKMVKQ